jgi:hypothetical protein
MESQQALMITKTENWLQYKLRHHRDIKDVLPIIFSEAMNDINGMLEAQ